jgi:type I restriction enzyme, S subunit
MAKGNRTIDLYEDDLWKRVFFDSVGTYVNVINHELSNEYPLEPLSNYIKIGGGYAFKTSEYKKSGIPIIRISDFNNEQIDISNCVYYDEDDSLAKYELSENDIIICLTGGTIAKLGIVQSGLGKLYMNQRVGRFDILDNSKFEKEYVYWIARSVQSIIKNLAWGAAIPNVSPKQIEKLEFSFPPIKVQQQIIEFLNDLKNNTVQNRMYFNESIEKHIVELQNNNLALKNVNSELTHQLDLIKQLRQAFLREAMQGKLCHAELVSASKETGHDLLAKIKAEKAQLIAEKKLKKEKELPPITKEEIPFEIPEHWAWCRLGEIAEVKRGKSPKYSENGVFRMLNQKCVRWFFIDTQHSKAIDEKWYNSITSDLKLKTNDLLVNSTGDGTIGRSGIADSLCEEFMFDSHILRVRSFLEINQNLLCFIINSEYGQSLIESIKGATSTKQTELGVNNLSSFPIPLPPLHEQEQIVVKLEELMAFCDGLEQSIKESQGYNEKLLQQVLREALQGKEVEV